MFVYESYVLFSAILYFPGNPFPSFPAALKVTAKSCGSMTFERHFGSAYMTKEGLLVSFGRKVRYVHVEVDDVVCPKSG